MGAGQAFNQAMQSQSPQVIGHLPGGELVWGQAQERREQRPQIAVGEPVGQQTKGDQGVEQGLDARVGEAQGRHPLPRHCLPLVDLLKGVFAQEAIVAEGLDVQQTSVGLEADLPQGGHAKRFSRWPR
jgi:hypothetical protein